ncbi:MAG TPA: extracellular solute-binding protein, partial [Candidatus Atribacteria bacterium]|nr:extracellular solute-binding protein [Candidatus Atribacteria bacterium]
PKNFKWRMMGVPYPEDGKGDPTAFYMDQDIATSWVVPSKAKHPEIALDFLRYMTSLENAKYVSAEKGAIVPVKGSEVALKSEALKSAVAVYSKAKTIWTYSGTYQVWYPTINKALETGIQALLSQEITPEQFLDKVEKEAEKVRKDSTIPKHTY